MGLLVDVFVFDVIWLCYVVYCVSYVYSLCLWLMGM